MNLDENKAFEYWCFTAKLPTELDTGGTDFPLLTHLLHRVCDHNAEKFELACEMLKVAFEAGQKVGKNV